jgi:cell division protease FtsH
VTFFLWIGRRGKSSMLGGASAFGRSRAKIIEAERPTMRFADVAGYEGVKQEVSEVADFLRAPERYAAAGVTGPKGVIMVGPPGTGKTLIARAVAGEAQVPFLSVTGSAFVEMFVGVGASRVRDLFEDARKRAPSIIFIDEIDAIGERRGGGSFGGGEEREQTLDQLLAEMDGFDESSGVVVLAATNRPDTLDQAVLRPGRFGRQVVVPLLNQAERAAILAVHCEGKHVDPAVDLSTVARATPGFSGADLANLVNEAAINAVQRAIDEEVSRLLRQAENRAVELLRRHRPSLDRLSALLVERETVDGTAVLSVLKTEQQPPIVAGVL